MTTTLEEYDPLKASKKRIENADSNNYREFSNRNRREFRYSDRRLFKQSKTFAVSAVAGNTIYCGFLGPSGVTLADPTESTTKSVLTYRRYPVSYRRRMRFFKDFVKVQGTPDLTQSINSNMTVFMGSDSETEKYLAFAKNKSACVTAASTGGELTENIIVARYCCEANGWAFNVPTAD